jgi:hypothetical protein
MCHTPLKWYEQKNLGHKAHFLGLPQRTVVFASTLLVSWKANLYPNCKLKILHQANIQYTNYAYKITKIHFNSQILTQTKCQQISLSLHYIAKDLVRTAQ